MSMSTFMAFSWILLSSSDKFYREDGGKQMKQREGKTYKKNKSINRFINASKSHNNNNNRILL